MNFNSNNTINQGNATKNLNAYKDATIDKIDIEIYDKDVRILNMLYINALGDVMTGCDFSYIAQEDIKLGNVLDNDIYTILKNTIHSQ